jgi:hypothetical protein
VLSCEDRQHADWKRSGAGSAGGLAAAVFFARAASAFHSSSNTAAHAGGASALAVRCGGKDAHPARQAASMPIAIITLNMCAPARILFAARILESVGVRDAEEVPVPFGAVFRNVR